MCLTALRPTSRDESDILMCAPLTCGNSDIAAADPGRERECRGVICCRGCMCRGDSEAGSVAARCCALAAAKKLG